MSDKTIRIGALVVGMALSPSACGGGSQASSGGEEGTATATGGDDLPEGDGDPSTGDGDGEPLCDVSQLPTLEPLWLNTYAETPAGVPFFQTMAMSEEALFVGASYTKFDGEPLGDYLARFELDGQPTWSLDVPALGYALETDGVHVYYDDGANPATFYRVAVDGTEDAWVLPLPDDTPTGRLTVGVAQPSLIIFGDQITEVGDPPYTDAIVARFPKGDGAPLGTSWFGEPARDDRAVRAVESPSGGFYVMIRHGGRGAYSIEGYALAGPAYSAEVNTGGLALALLSREDGLLIGGFEDDTVWTQKLGPTGEEAWRRHVKPCGDAPVRNLGLVDGQEELWGVAILDGGLPVFMKLDFEGQLLGAFRVDGLVNGVQGAGIVSNGDAVVVSTVAPNAPDGPVSYLARVQ